MNVSARWLLPDEPIRPGEVQFQFMQRVQRRACNVSFWLGWLPGIWEMTWTYTHTQRRRFEARQDEHL